MIGVEVCRNGKVLCTAGVEEGTVGAIVSLSGRQGEDELSVGGLDTHSPPDQQFLQWVRQPVAPGDVIEVRIKELPCADEPAERRIERASFRDRAERAYYEMLKKKYEPEL